MKMVQPLAFVLMGASLQCGSPTSPADQAPAAAPDAAQEPDVDPADALPALCSTCAGGDTTDFGGEPGACKVERRELEDGEAEQLGYDLAGLSGFFERTMEAPVQWKSAPEETLLQVTLSITGYSILEREARSADTSCPDVLQLHAEVQIDAADASVSGSFEATGQVTTKGELEEPLLLNVWGWANDLRGTLTLDIEELGSPQALRASVHVLLSGGRQRLGLQLGGLYDQDLTEGRQGYVTSLQEASPIDACPAFSLPEGDDCVNAEPI